MILEYFEYLFNQLNGIGIVDIIDIFIVAVIFFYTYKFVRDRRAGKLLLGIVLLVILLLISEVAEMQALNYILKNLFSVGLIAIVIVFQPELRSALEKMGGIGGDPLKGIKDRFDSNSASQMRAFVGEICTAVDGLSQTKTGALIVIERTTRLGDHIRTGTVIDAVTSSFLLGNIFFDKAPLHDGAVILRDGRIHAAGCFLPLSQNDEIVKELGTRHRAGIGISEISDAIVVIVSEETGLITVAVDGDYKRGFSRKTLEEYLDNLLVREEKSRIKGKIFKRHSGGKNGKNT